MKRFKNLFLPITAVLAISFTVVAHEGSAVKKTPLHSKFTYICRQGVDYTRVSLCISGVPTVYDIALNSTCPGDLSLFCASLASLETTNTSCDGGNHFCCAEPVQSGISCPQRGCDNAASKVEVFCKP